jgi:hypothetical protein
MGCFGARGDNGSPFLGDNGGDAIVIGPSRGIRGRGEPSGRSPGRGLAGNPGLIGGEAIRCCSLIEDVSLLGGLKTAAIELCADR